MSLLQVKRANPEKNCFLEYDRLYIDHKIYVYNDVMGQESVLRHQFDHISDRRCSMLFP